MKRRSFKILNILIVLLIVANIFLSSGLSVYAINDEFDNPEDNITSQNEQSYDIMNDSEIEGRPVINGTGYILYDATSQSILQGLNIDTRLEPASMTKVVTVLIALETLELEEIVTITDSMYQSIPEGYQMLGIMTGEEVSVKDLIYAAMLISANDAALALAIHMAGSESAFVTWMNDRVQEIGCVNTTFSSAYGLADPNNTTTAYDMALILNEATTNPTFSQIATTLTYVMTPTNLYSDNREFSNANRFVSTTDFSYESYIGGKTGFTDSAGYTLCSASLKNDRKIIGVILGSSSPDQRYYDMISLFDFAYNNTTTMVIDPGEYQGLYSETLDQIDNVIIDTGLSISHSEITFSPYLTTVSTRATLGSSNTVELSNMIIDTTLEQQSFNVPVLKSYTDGKTYIIGSINLTISTKDRVIEITPEKKSGWTIIKDIVIAFIVVLAIILICLYGILRLRKNLRRKRDEEIRNRSHML